jgi:hypothetical protein
MVITLQDGWGASEIDFQLQFTPEANGSVQLYAFDFAGNLITPVDGGNLFTVSYQNSESQSYRAVTTGGRLIRQVWIKATTSVGGLRAIDHIRQVGLDGLVQRLHYGSAYATPGLPSGIAYSASNIAPSALNGLGGANNSASSGGGTAGTPGGGNSQASVPPGRIPSTPTTGSSFSLPLSVEITTDAVQEAFVRERDLDLLDRLTLPTGAFVRERNTHPTTTPPTGPEAPGSLGLIDAGSSNGALGSHGNPGNHGSQGSTHQFIPEHNGNPQSNEPPGGTPWLPIDETSFTGPGLETSAVTANPEPSTLTMWLIAVGICGSRRIRKHLKSVA